MLIKSEGVGEKGCRYFSCLRGHENNRDVIGIVI